MMLILGQPTRASSQGSTIPDLIRNHDASKGPFVLLMNPAFVVMEIPALVSEADLVVEGTIDRSTSVLTRDRKSIETMVDVAVSDVLVQNSATISVPAAAIRRLQILQPGGETEVDGRIAAVAVLGGARLEVAARFVLFLKKLSGAGEGVFTIVNGAYGVFSVQDAHVSSLAPASASSIHQYDGVTIEAFATVVKSTRVSEPP